MAQASGVCGSQRACLQTFHICNRLEVKQWIGLMVGQEVSTDGGTVSGHLRILHVLGKERYPLMSYSSRLSPPTLHVC